MAEVFADAAGCPFVYYTAVQQGGEAEPGCGRRVRFWLGFIDREIDLIERGRGELLLERFGRSWPAYRVDARHVGAFWNRTGTIEVDLVGGDRRPMAGRIDFVGSVKWRESRPFSRADGLALAASGPRSPEPVTAPSWSGSAPQGFDDDAPLDVRLAPLT